jgi:hypothetical protein
MVVAADDDQYTGYGPKFGNIDDSDAIAAKTNIGKDIIANIQGAPPKGPAPKGPAQAKAEAAVKAKAQARAQAQAQAQAQVQAQARATTQKKPQYSGYGPQLGPPLGKVAPEFVTDEFGNVSLSKDGKNEEAPENDFQVASATPFVRDLTGKSDVPPGKAMVVADDTSPQMDDNKVAEKSTGIPDDTPVREEQVDAVPYDEKAREAFIDIISGGDSAQDNLLLQNMFPTLETMRSCAVDLERTLARAEKQDWQGFSTLASLYCVLEYLSYGGEWHSEVSTVAVNDAVLNAEPGKRAVDDETARNGFINIISEAGSDNEQLQRIFPTLESMRSCAADLDRTVARAEKMAWLDFSTLASLFCVLEYVSHGGDWQSGLSAREINNAVLNFRRR